MVAEVIGALSLLLLLFRVSGIVVADTLTNSKTAEKSFILEIICTFKICRLLN